MNHYDKIWWLVDKHLGGMPKPPIEEIPKLYNQGLRAVASFLEADDNIAEYKAQGFEVLHLPIVDDQAPTAEQAKTFTIFAAQMKEAGLPLAVHCKGGNGRAGTMLAAFFILNGGEPAEVLNFMREINPKAVATKTQEDFLFSLK